MQIAVIVVYVFFFFFKQKTAYEMRISDWSSDVCSSDLLGPKDDDTSAYHIFERLNTGGTPLTAQEIRHCVFHGPIVDELSKVNENAAWRKIIGKAPLDKHQKDIELILRTLAISTRTDAYEKQMKEFLNATMTQNKERKSE